MVDVDRNRVERQIENGDFYFDKIKDQIMDHLGVFYYSKIEGDEDIKNKLLDTQGMLDYQLWDLSSRVIGLSFRVQTEFNYRSYTVRIPHEVGVLRDLYMGEKMGATHFCQSYFSTDGELFNAGIIKTSTLFEIIKSKAEFLKKFCPITEGASGLTSFWVIPWEDLDEETHYIF